MQQKNKIHSMMEKYNNIPAPVKASFWFLVCSFLQKGIAFITTPIFTRIMDTAEYGQYSVFTSWHGIFSVVVSLKLSAGVYTRGLVEYEEERPQFVSAFQGLSFMLTVIWIAIYILFQNFWNRMTGLTTVRMLAMLVMIWLSAVFGFWSAEKRVDFKYKKLVAVTVLVSILNPFLGIILMHFWEDKVSARIFGIILVETVAYVGLFFTQIKKGKLFYSRRFWKYALSFNIPLIPHYLSMTILSSADRIMISNMAGDNEAGIYNLAYQISMIMTMFNNALMQTIEPWLYKKIKENAISSMSKVAYPTFTAIALLNILLIAFAPEVIAVFAPIEYLEAVWIIPPVAMSSYFMFAYTFFAVFEFYFSKTKFISAATMGGAVLNVVLNYILIDRFGYMAAGYTTLLCYIIYTVCHYICMKKICRDYLENQNPYSTKILLFITVCFIAVGFVFLGTYGNIWLRYGLIAVVGAAGIMGRKKIAAFAKELMSLRK
uniref:lipopolysaccharide biosynthesis protein n=1 Tax=Agathobacter sp. TaxID=2021311 RepID=UPI0040572F82